MALSAGAVALAPLALAVSYSWTANAISESAAQAVKGAWVGRLGLLLMGLAVLWLAALAAPRWGPLGTFSFRCFGALMIAAAVFSHRPWEADVPFDLFEDLLHSVAATGMGFALAIGVIVVAMRRGSPKALARIFDIAAVAGAVLIPLAMSAEPQAAGLFQRSMFAIAYVWFGSEALQSGVSIHPT